MPTPTGQVVLVTGGRTYDDAGTVYAALDVVHATTPIGLLVHGAARGADTLAAEWAQWRGVAVAPCPADWAQYGKAAGVIRNRAMLADYHPDLVVAFPGGRGTADMVHQAERVGISVLYVA